MGATGGGEPTQILVKPGSCESGSSPEFVVNDNWSVSRMLQQIEVDEKSLMSKIRADERGWTFGLQKKGGNLPRVNPKREKSCIEPA